ncbi:UNVERIFIED_CONTAM: hypothetical protein FKN15_058804 [Acipenser sinensis]
MTANDTFGICLLVSVQALSDIGGFVLRCSIASMPWCFGILSALRATRLEIYKPRGFLSLCSGAFGATLPQSLGTLALQCPRCLDDSTSRHFDALNVLSSAYCALGGPRCPCTPYPCYIETFGPLVLHSLGSSVFNTLGA